MPAPIIAPLSAAMPVIAPVTKGLGSMGLAKFGIPIAGGLSQIPAVKKGMQTVMQPGIDTVMDMYGKGQDTRGYITGYDTKQNPFEVAKERGLAGVLGGGIDNITMGATDFDKRGDSKKQKDVKDFLRKFIFGSQGVDARKTRDEMGGGDITSFSPGERPGEFNYSFDANPNTQMMKPSPGFAGMI